MNAYLAPNERRTTSMPRSLKLNDAFESDGALGPGLRQLCPYAPQAEVIVGRFAPHLLLGLLLPPGGCIHQRLERLIPSRLPCRDLLLNRGICQPLDVV
jgi:hypothetical protein